MRTKTRRRACGVWGVAIVAVVAPGGLVHGQPPGWEYGLERAKPAYMEQGDQRPLERQPWVRAMRRAFPEQINTVKLRGQPERLPLEAVAEDPSEGEGAAFRAAEGAPAPLDLEAVEARLPRAIGDLPRMRDDGGGTVEAGVVVDPASLVQARYASADRAREVTISVVDLERGLSEPDRAAIRRLVGMEFHRETGDGYERTREVQGFPAVERLHRPTRTAELSLLAGERVGVRVEGRGVPMATLEAALSGLNLQALAALGP